MWITHVSVDGGASAPGFKHGPALRTMLAELVMEHKDADPLFRLGRLNKTK
jgi:hypothetical protein